MDTLYERLLKFTRDAVYQYTVEEGRIILANQGLVDVLELDCPPEELVGKHLRDLLIYTEAEGSLREEVVKTGEIHDYEYHFKTNQGNDKWVIHDAFVTRHVETGELIVEAVAKDITQRKRAEMEIEGLNRKLQRLLEARTAELDAANAELQAFAYSVSHDLRAPIRHIRSFAHMLQDAAEPVLDETARGYLTRILNNGQRLEDLLDSLLTLANASQSEMEITDVDLSSLARDLLQELRLMGERSIDVEIEPGMIARGDAHLLRIVLKNLLGNAWKATVDRDPARIRVGVALVDGVKMFFVRDNGIGFDGRHADKLFAPLHRYHAPTEFPGVGMGLAIVRRAIHRHGGRMSAEGKPGEGATFYFSVNI